MKRLVVLTFVAPSEALAGRRPHFSIGPHPELVLGVIAVALGVMYVGWRLNEPLTRRMLRVLVGCIYAVGALVALGTCAAQLYFLTTH